MLIAFLTDFGYSDPYAGIMKGIVSRINPKIKCVDITHGVPSHDIVTGAFFLLVSYRSFPSGTIFVVVIDPGVGGKREGVCVKTASYCFVAPNNGVLQWVLSEEPVLEAVELTNSLYWQHPVSSTFHGRDIFAPCAAHLSTGVEVLKLGKALPVNRLKSLSSDFSLKPIISGDLIYGNVLSVDRFGNIATTIKKKDINNSRDFFVEISGVRVYNFVSSYEEAVPYKFPIKDKTVSGEKFYLLWNSFGYLEIALNQGNARDALDVKVGDKVEVHFAANTM